MYKDFRLQKEIVSWLYRRIPERKARGIEAVVCPLSSIGAGEGRGSLYRRCNPKVPTFTAVNYRNTVNISSQPTGNQKT